MAAEGGAAIGGSGSKPQQRPQPLGRRLMRLRPYRSLTTAVAMGALSAWLAAAPQVRRVDDNGLRRAGASGDEWLTYGLTQAETRYSPLAEINADNVKRLGLAWS